jgi:hypothetical protein
MRHGLVPPHEHWIGATVDRFEHGNYDGES